MLVRAFIAFLNPMSIDFFTTVPLGNGNSSNLVTVRNAWPYLVISGGCDLVCALAAAGQLNVVMKETAETENEKAVAFALTFVVAVIDGFILKGCTTFLSGRHSRSKAS